MRKTVTALRPTARVSWKDSVKIFRKIKGKHVEKVKNFLNDLINQKRDIDGKFYTGATKEILSLIEEVENNADSLEMDREKLYLKEAVVNKAFTYMLPKSRWSHRGRKAKICQLKVTLEER
jgi:ribosomal protein L22